MSKNIVYHHNFYDTIREAKDAEKLRSILKKVETEIKERVGNNHYKFYKEASNEEKETIEKFFHSQYYNILCDVDPNLLMNAAVERKFKRMGGSKKNTWC